MERALPVSVVCLYLIGCAWAEVPVYFTDPNLKTAVEDELWIPDPTPADMLGLVFLRANGKGITDLTGLEYAANLVTFEATRNEIRDISVVGGLTHLQEIVLNNNEIADISVVAGLTNLYHLDIHNNLVTDIAAVAGLSGLRTVILRINQISDISPLSRLSDLEYLDLRNNQISDIQPLAELQKLRYVDLQSNQIVDISPLSHLTCLFRLQLDNNPINEEACNVYIPLILQNNPGIELDHPPCTPVHLSISSGTGGSVIAPGEGQFIYERMETVRIAAKADPGFAFAGFSGTYFTYANPTFIIMDRDHQIEANFVSMVEVLHVDNGALGDPDPGDPDVSDPDENGTREHPFDGVQEAIEVAGEGTTVIVRPGIYRENIDFLRKNVRLIGRDANDPTPQSWPVLEGVGNGPVVRLAGGQSPVCLLAGFVITRGKGEPAGAIHCAGASPTIANCLIVGNRSTAATGAAVYCINSRALLTNCTIADNYGGPNGAGLTLIDSSVTVLNSILWDNLPQEVLASGTSVPDIRYCDVRDWWPGDGNLNSDPLFARPGVWVNPDDPHEILGSANAWAVWVGGDYHLQSQAGRWDPRSRIWVLDDLTSPCLDRGDPAGPVGAEPAPNGGIINLGAYGGTTEASKSVLEMVAP